MFRNITLNRIKKISLVSVSRDPLAAILIKHDFRLFRTLFFVSAMTQKYVTVETCDLKTMPSVMIFVGINLFL